MSKTKSLTREQFLEFDSLMTGLSPENLTCDGELSRREVQRRYNAIMKEWRKLEKKVGRSVSEEEVERILINGFSTGRHVITVR